MTDVPVEGVGGHLMKVDEELAAVFEGGADVVPGPAPCSVVLQQPQEGLGVGREHSRDSNLLGLRETTQQPEGGGAWVNN